MLSNTETYKTRKGNGKCKEWCAGNFKYGSHRNLTASLFYRWGKWGSDKLNNFPMVSQWEVWWNLNSAAFTITLYGLSPSSNKFSYKGLLYQIFLWDYMGIFNLPQGFSNNFLFQCLMPYFTSTLTFTQCSEWPKIFGS